MSTASTEKVPSSPDRCQAAAGSARIRRFKRETGLNPSSSDAGNEALNTPAIQRAQKMLFRQVLLVLIKISPIGFASSAPHHNGCWLVPLSI